MTILPKKRVGKEKVKGKHSTTNELSENPGTSTSHAVATRHSRSLLSPTLLLKDPVTEQSLPCTARRRTKRKARDQLDTSASKTNVCPSQSYENKDSDNGLERCNSEDEYEPIELASGEDWETRDEEFLEMLRKKGFVVKNMVEDGACLFRAIADQVYGNEDMHTIVRHNCMDYIYQNREFFQAYITENIDKYVARKRNHFVHGNHLELQALSEMFNRIIEIYSYSEVPIYAFHHGQNRPVNDPIRLAYLRGSHYDSLTYSAERLPEPTTDNELNLIEQTMIQDKIAATDYEATNKVILEQATKESLAIYVNDAHIRDPHAGCSSSPPAACSTSADTSRGIPRVRGRGTNARGQPPSPTGNVRYRIATPPASSPQPRVLRATSARLNSKSLPSSPQNLGQVSIPSTSTNQDGQDYMEPYEENVCMQMPPEVFGLNNWDEDAAMMAKVLAESQQEYLESLKSDAQVSYIDDGSRDADDDEPGPSYKQRP